MLRPLWAVCAAGALLLAGCDGSQDRSERRPEARLEILSGPAEWVSGGDARIAVHLDGGDLEALQLWLNGERIEPQRVRAGATHVEGIVAGLEEGNNQLELRHPRHGVIDSLALVNHPLQGPMFSGPQQYPFVCTADTEIGAQLRVDVAEPPASPAPPVYPVTGAGGTTIGYSADCVVEEPMISYQYKTTAGAFADLPADGSRPSDMATTTLDDGRTVDFIVRWERGTINRFIYSHMALAPLGDDPLDPDPSLWDGRLIYSMQGGVAFGHSQGRFDQGRAREEAFLGRGYAVIYSTANRTSTHYNLTVGGETAMMVKENFIKRYGKPLYTVATGASGGAIQQYIYAQNHPGLIDAAVPTQPYTDMVSQTIHIGDCELLEYYMDVTSAELGAKAEKWQNVENRRWLMGLNGTVHRASAGEHQLMLQLKALLPSNNIADGPTECRVAWMGLTAGAMNPNYMASIRNSEKMVPQEALEAVQWSHFDDLRNIYGETEDGWPRYTWDNVGVQYGLQALVDGHIDAEEFLHLNARIGGWKAAEDMVPEVYPYEGSLAWAMESPAERVDPWSRRNMLTPPDAQTPVPRTEGDVIAIRNAHNGGQVFSGHIDIPVIDWRPYLEHVLDMHNVHQSFGLRKRIQDRMGSADHQVIWFTDARTEVPGQKKEFDQRTMAFAVIDEWMANIRDNPERSVAENRPEAAVDSCFDNEGEPIAVGEDVWSGVLDDGPAGACTQLFPIYSNSRMVAGAPIEGGIFKCALQSVDEAIAKGLYGSWTPNADEKAKLQAIFPQGVCDYEQPTQGLPEGFGEDFGAG